MIAEGTAFLDRSGRLLAADKGFRLRMGLPDVDAANALQRCADTDPALKALIAGEGPDRVRLASGNELLRTACPEGAFLVAIAQERPSAPPDALEHVMHSEALRRLAAGLAHDVKNPLNAMALQLALLSDKLAAAAEEGVASSTAPHLDAVKEQIGRVNEFVRRFLDVADPTAPLGYTDVAALVGDIAKAHAHDARRRRVEVTAEVPRGAVRAASDPARIGRVLLGLFCRALTETPAGGKLIARAAIEGDDVVVHIEHTAGAAAPELAYVIEVVAAAAEAMGGRLETTWKGAVERVELRLPRDDRP